MLKIVTDHKWKQFRYRDEVPKGILKSQFGWTDEGHEANGDYSDGFICYKGYWYHLADFMRSTTVEGWHGYHGDSYFSGVLIRVSDDGETYQIATYYEVSGE